MESLLPTIQLQQLPHLPIKAGKDWEGPFSHFSLGTDQTKALGQRPQASSLSIYPQLGQLSCNTKALWFTWTVVKMIFDDLLSLLVNPSGTS